MAVQVELGYSTFALGRVSGGMEMRKAPSVRNARGLLVTAYDEGIRFFDTAPSYGSGEKRLGDFLKSLSGKERAAVRVATKIGRYWDEEQRIEVEDYSLEAVKRSIGTSQDHLGQISVLHLDQPTTYDILRHKKVERALEYAGEVLGNVKFGVSAGDVSTAQSGALDPRFRSVQMPYNTGHSSKYGNSIRQAARNGKQIIINHPFAEEAIAEEEQRKAAFSFVMKEAFQGVVLTGTTSPSHLAENCHTFDEVWQELNTTAK